MVANRKGITFVKHVVSLVSTAGLCGVVACSSISSPTLYVRDPSYDFRGKTVGVCVILDPVEQEALSDQRVVNRVTSSGQTEGYASEMTEQPLEEDTGLLTPPKTVTSLQTKLKHWRYYDEDFTLAMVDEVSAELQKRGFKVRVIPVPEGQVELVELAQRAQSDTCQILAVVTVTVARSWNIRHQQTLRSTQDLSSSMRWVSYTGGLVLCNIAMFDIATNKVVWQHSQRVVPLSRTVPVIAELYDNEVASTRFSSRPGLYQGWMYRQAMPRAVRLMFETAESGFIPLPRGSESVIADTAPAPFASGRRVFVRPDSSSRLWFPATVIRDSAGVVSVQWVDGIWEAYGRRVEYPRSDVRPRDEFPEIVWVRTRDRLEFTPYRFVRVDVRGLVHVTRAGDMSPSTFLPGRIGVVLE